MTSPGGVPDLLAFAHLLADAGGAAIMPYWRAPIDVVNKQAGGYDPVTAADKDGETAIRALIKRTYPAHGIVGEEHGHEPGEGPYTWVLDPIDGTRAFITGMPVWGTLIALNEGARPLIGVIDQPVLGERFVGHPGGAEFHARGGVRPLKTRACPDLSQAVMSSTHPWGYFTKEERAAMRPLWEGAQLTRFGGDCYAYGLLAMGFIDLIVEATLKVWDVAALIPVIEGAGGVITNWRGEPAWEGGQIVAAGDRRVHEQALRALRPAAV